MLQTKDIFEIQWDVSKKYQSMGTRVMNFFENTHTTEPTVPFFLAVTSVRFVYSIDF
jgi:hypothetical protein